MYIITKCSLGYVQYEIYYPMTLNKTAQQNSQHCTKLHNEVYNEVHNMLHSKIYWNIEFSLCFVKQVENRFTASIDYSSYY